MTTPHDNTIKNLAKHVKNEKVIFIDQFGKFHKVYSNLNNEVVLTEASYNLITKETTPRIYDENRTKSDSIKRMKDSLIPDISIMNNKRYTYWIEAVNTSPCNDEKMSQIISFDFPTLEFSIYDFSYVNKKRIIPCFDISKVNEKEYAIIKNYYKYKNKFPLFDFCLIDLFMSPSNTNIFNKLSKKIESAKISGRENVNDEVGISKETSVIDNVTPMSVLDDIMTVAIPKMIDENCTLCLEGVIEKCIQNRNYSGKDETQLIKVIKNKIWDNYQLRIYNLKSPFYKDDALEKFNLKRRISIMTVSLSEQFLQLNGSLKDK